MSTTATPTGATQPPFLHCSIPTWHIITSMVGLGPIPFTKIFAVLALVAETNRFARRRGDHKMSGSLTDLESAVRARSIKNGQNALHEAVTGPIETRMKTLKALHAEINLLDRVIKNTTDAPIIGPRGERYTYADALQAHNEAREQINAETRQGSSAHHLKPHQPWWMELGLLLIDLPVFAFAMFGLLNVNPRLIGYDYATQIKAVVAGTFAVLGTVILAVVMRTMGRRHRAHKGADGVITTRSTAANWTIRLELAGMVVVAAAAAGVMAARVVIEGIAADASPYLTTALAVMFSSLIAYASYINYRATYDNGSPLTDRAHHLSFQLRARDHALDQRRLERQLKVEEACVTTAKLNREISNATSRSLRRVHDGTADKAILVARSYHQNDYSPLPEPTLDQSGIKTATHQALALAEHQRHLVAQAPPNNATSKGNHDIEQYDLMTLLSQTSHANGHQL